jgi:hypothetical protein
VKAGLYEARSLLVDKTAYIVLDDASDLRRKLHVARSALRVLRWQVRGRTASATVHWALRDVEEG